MSPSTQAPSHRWYFRALAATAAHIDTARAGQVASTFQLQVIDQYRKPTRGNPVIFLDAVREPAPGLLANDPACP